jgi:hypothetical protein
MKNIFVGRRLAALTLTLATLTAIGSQPAFAVVPEIKADPQRGKYISNPDLEAAVLTIQSATRHEEPRWRHAPWFAS